MIVLLLGSGGREHALAWKMAQSALVTEIHALPGSDGIAAIAKVKSCIPGNPSDTAAVLKAAQSLKPDFVFVGPDNPLEAGVVDVLEDAGFLTLGPRKSAARLESSKIFAKEFMAAEGIPTAKFTVCNSHDEAVKALESWPIEENGVVIKADGLSVGKGVVVTRDRAEAIKTAHDFILNPACTVKTDRLLLEHKVKGKEVSAFALCDGDTFVQIGYACDYKRVRDNDQGPNTGGMGCYIPEGWPSESVRSFVTEGIIRRTITGMKRKGNPFKGILYVGLMIDGEDVNVIEFNARFGDPETQVLLPMIEDDLVPLFLAAAKGELATAKAPTFKKSAAVHVVMASEGYPETFGAGMRLGEKIDLPPINDNAIVFIAGAKKKDGAWVNSGGRVLGVTALGATINDARDNAYKAIDQIHFNGAHWRKDIGK
jgi:phosphoribosylamine--glycine ligase